MKETSVGLGWYGAASAIKVFASFGDTNLGPSNFSGTSYLITRLGASFINYSSNRCSSKTVPGSGYFSEGLCAR
jgi:hypothetical protein